MDLFIELIGFTAAALTTIAFFPQVIKIWKTKSTRDLSLGLFLILTTGVLLWLIYGILITNWPIIVANFVTLILTGSILFFKLRFK